MRNMKRIKEHGRELGKDRGKRGINEQISKKWENKQVESYN